MKRQRSFKNFVECYFIWEGDSKETLQIESPPSALCSLVINYKDSYSISNKKYQKYEVPACFISGQALSNYTFHISGEIGVTGIVFKPAAIYHFYGIPMYQLTDERICFSQIRSEDCKQLLNQIRKTSTAKEKITILENYLMEIWQSNKIDNLSILNAANKIFDLKGKVNINELLDHIPLSRRNFERKFLEEVGVSPKSYAKIRRFGYTCSLMAGKRNINLLDVLIEGGYYDQSHFIKDFKYFSGRTPRKYAKTNVELANYLDSFSIVEQRLQNFSS